MEFTTNFLSAEIVSCGLKRTSFPALRYGILFLLCQLATVLRLTEKALATSATVHE